MTTPPTQKQQMAALVAQVNNLTDEVTDLTHTVNTMAWLFAELTYGIKAAAVKRMLQHIQPQQQTPQQPIGTQQFHQWPQVQQAGPMTAPPIDPQLQQMLLQALAAKAQGQQ